MENNQTRQHIAVVVDGSGRDISTLRKAAQIAADLSARVTLLWVVVPPRGGFPARSPDLLPAIDLAEGEVDEHLRSYAKAFPGLTVTRRVLVGRRASEEIAVWLRQNPADFVVASHEAKRSLARLFLHGAVQVLRRSGLVPAVAARGYLPAREWSSGRRG